MPIKWIGAAMIMTTCTVIGFRVASHDLMQTRMLRTLIIILDKFSCELSYRLTPLPELCQQASGLGKYGLEEFFGLLSNELEQQISPDVAVCTMCALSKCTGIPNKVKDVIKILGDHLGIYDLEGQLKGIETVRAECYRLLDVLEHGMTSRIRTYRTLGLCAGAALIILFI